MRNNDFSAWTLLLSAALLGSITTVMLGGCKPPNSVDVSTGALSSNQTVSGDNVTSSTNSVAATAVGGGGNVTVTGGAVAVETPVAATPDAETPDAETPDAETPDAETPDAETPDAENPDAETPDAETPDSGTLIAKPAGESTVSEWAGVEEVMSSGGDWPQWGGTREKNNVPGVKDVPISWNIGKFDRGTGAWDNSKAENIRYYSNLGSQTYGNPVVAGGSVFVGTNNGAGHLQRYPSEVDLGCLLAFDEATGDFLWQHSSEKLITGRVHDWPLQGICCAPMVEGERLWFVTSRGEVRCLDTKGFHDGEDDGPVKDEPAFVAEIMNAGPTVQTHADTIAGLNEGVLIEEAKAILAGAGEAVEGPVKVETVAAGKVWKASGNFGGVDRELTIKQIGPRISFFKALGVHDKGDADVIWVFNMMEELGTSQHNMASCSVTSYGKYLFVNTSNGLDESHINLPAPSCAQFHLHGQGQRGSPVDRRLAGNQHPSRAMVQSFGRRVRRSPPGAVRRRRWHLVQFPRRRRQQRQT